MNIILLIVVSVLLYLWSVRQTPVVALDEYGKAKFKKHVQPISACLGLLPFLMMVIMDVFEKYSSLPTPLIHKYTNYIPFLVIFIGVLLSLEILRRLKRYTFEPGFVRKYMKGSWLMLSIITIALVILNVVWDGEL